MASSNIICGSRFLQLNDDCILKIFECASLLDLSILRSTCQRLKSLADYYYSSRSPDKQNIFRLDCSIRDESDPYRNKITSKEMVLRNFGGSFESMKFDTGYCIDPNQMLRIVHRYCLKLNSLEIIISDRSIYLKIETIAECVSLFANRTSIDINESALNPESSSVLYKSILMNCSTSLK